MKGLAYLEDVHLTGNLYLVKWYIAMSSTLWIKGGDEN